MNRHTDTMGHILLHTAIDCSSCCSLIPRIECVCSEGACYEVICFSLAAVNSFGFVFDFILRKYFNCYYEKGILVLKSPLFKV